MKHKRPPVPVIVVLALALLAGVYFGLRALFDDGSDALTASGTIEAVSVAVSPEIGGRVAEVLVDEGDLVQAGDLLFRLDDTLLRIQQDAAAASLETARAAVQTARANYDLVLASARLEAATARTSDWRAANPAGYDLPGGYFSRADQITAARSTVDEARLARDAAADDLEALLADPANADFAAAEMRLLNARFAFLVAQDVLTRANASANADLQSSAQEAYDAARDELDEARSAYDDLEGGQAAEAVVAARAVLVAAEERYQAAQDRLLALQIGEYSPRVAAAAAALDQTEAAAVQAEAGLALLEAQVARLTVTAPSDGTVLTRAVQPGEVVSPGAAVLTLARLDDLTITVYVPEDRYGELSLGQSAALSVDSFPGETFEAVVVHIAGQAEFTPRNVQTVEGRKTTVFAVRLQVRDPGGKLKPGMPADVTFTR